MLDVHLRRDSHGVQPQPQLEGEDTRPITDHPLHDEAVLARGRECFQFAQTTDGQGDCERDGQGSIRHGHALQQISLGDRRAGRVRR